MSNIVVHSFNSGLLSPKIDTRADIAKYASGCRILSNMIPQKYGCAERRPGTLYRATAKNSPQGIRLLPFIYNSDIAYVVELGNLYARFYYNGSYISEITTPYTVDDLPALQYVQIGDVMWLVHRHYAPRQLKRTTTTTFTLTAIAFEGGPFLTRNDIANNDGVTLKCNKTAVGQSGTMTASANLFDNLHVGALFQLTFPVDDTMVSTMGPSDPNNDPSSTYGGVTGNGTYPLTVKGTASFVTHGTWTGTIRLQRKDGSAAWEDYRVYEGLADRNIQFSWVEHENNISYRVWSDTGIGGNYRAELSIETVTQSGIYRIDAVTSATVAAVTVMQAAPTTNGNNVTTYRWAEGCWSGYRGYPSSVGIINGRIAYGATDHQPSTVWLSGVDDYDNFEAGVEDADSFSLTLTTHNEIVWLNALDGLVVGTTGGIWVGRSSRLDTPITPTNFNCKEYVTFGSAPIQAIKVNNSILYVDEARRKVREFTAGQTSDEYVAADLTALAENLTEGLISGIAFQKNPDPILWCTLATGMLLSCTYDREQDVVAWAEHPFGNIDGEYQAYPVLRAATEYAIPAAPTAMAEIDIAGATEVSDAAGLQAMSGSGKYKLTADIDLTGVTWTPIADFAGVLEGDNHKISNLVISNPATVSQALFRNLATNAQVRNVKLDQCAVTGNFYPRGGSAILASYAYQAQNLLLKNIAITNSTIGPNVPDGSNLAESGFLVGEWRDASGDIFNCTVDNCVLDGRLADHSLDGDGAWDVGGLIGFIALEKVSNYTINVVNCAATRLTIYGTGQVGGLIGSVMVQQISSSFLASHNTLKFVNCTTSGTIYLNDEFGGGIFGMGPGTKSAYSQDNTILVTGCSSTVAINLTAGLYGEFLGGFSGSISAGGSQNQVTVADCHATGNVTHSCHEDCEFIGGFAGDLTSIANNALRIYDCSSTGNITASLTESDAVQYLGGFAGYIAGENDTWSPYSETGLGVATNGSTVVRNCWSSGTVTAAFNNDTVSDGDIILTGGFTGSIDGAAVLYCHATGDVVLTTTHGGESVFTRDIQRIGGFAGEISAAASTSTGVFACWSSGSLNLLNISNQLNSTVPVAGSLYDLGGFAGLMTSTGTLEVSDCYAYGSITAESRLTTTVEDYEIGSGNTDVIHEIGGFAGEIIGTGSTLHNVYNIGAITNTVPNNVTDYIANVGGMLGLLAASNTVTDTYWDSQASGQTTSAAGTALSTAQAQTESSYLNWDFDHIWTMPDWGTNSVCVTPTTGEDTVTLATSRTIHGNPVRYLEEFAPRAFAGQADAYFIDAGSSFSGTLATTFTGLVHLEGETVKVLGDGQYRGEYVVSGGAITLDRACFTVQVGLPYWFQLQPMRLDDPRSRGMTRMDPVLYLSLLDTLGAKYGTSLAELNAIDWRASEIDTADPLLFTGDKRVNLESGLGPDDPILIAGNDPWPCTLRALVVKVSATGMYNGTE